MLARDEKIETTAAADYVARARALVPMIEAAADRIEQERRILPDFSRRCTRPASFACCCRYRSAAAGRFCDVQPGDRRPSPRRTPAPAGASASRSPRFACRRLSRSENRAWRFSARRTARSPGARRPAPRRLVTDGGYKVTGRWRFASGSGTARGSAATRRCSSATASRGSTTRAGRSSAPCCSARKRRQSTDIWHTVGLRGTGATI